MTLGRHRKKRLDSIIIFNVVYNIPLMVLLFFICRLMLCDFSHVFIVSSVHFLFLFTTFTHPSLCSPTNIHLSIQLFLLPRVSITSTPQPYPEFPCTVIHLSSFCFLIHLLPVHSLLSPPTSLNYSGSIICFLFFRQTLCLLPPPFHFTGT